MPTFTQIGTAQVVGSGGASSIDFTSIPATYTDLCVFYSLRGNSLEGVYVQFNSSTSNFTGRYIFSDSTSVSSASLARYIGSINSSASTFTNGSLYITNYAGSNNKSFSVDEVYDQNSTAGYLNFTSGLWSSSSAITSIRLEASAGLTQHSTAYLYGVSNA
jgi:hypothetical protein